MPFSERQGWDALWIVDPVDGTKEFIKRNGEFTVNVALVRDGRVAGGVVLAPVLGHAYVGVVGEGAWRLEVDITKVTSADEAWARRAALPFDAPEGRPFTVVASRSHMSPETEAYVEEARAQRGEVDLISKGSSLKLCMVAEGTADAYPRFAPTMEWDTAAGQAVCEAAGCDVIDQNTNEPMRYNREELLNAWFLVSRTN
jgi:3'(2'), 5'-bisphosphate nucleotidase